MGTWYSPNPHSELVKFKCHREHLGAQSPVFPVNKQPAGKDVKQHRITISMAEAEEARGCHLCSEHSAKRGVQIKEKEGIH